MFRSNLLWDDDDWLAIRASALRYRVMPLKVSRLVCILCLFPVFGYAQSDAYALHRVLQRFTEAYGGFRDADALASLSVEGVVNQDGQTYDFLMRKKRPDSMRYRLSRGENSVVTGYNGSAAWIRVETKGVVTIKELDSSAKSALRKQALFDSPLFRHLEKRENKLSLLERSVLDGNSVYVIELRSFGNQVSHYYLDLKTAHVLRHDQLNAEGVLTHQTFYRDYKEVEGFPFAHEIETRVGGQTVSLAKVHSIEVNPGLLSFYFEKPRQ